MAFSGFRFRRDLGALHGVRGGLRRISEGISGSFRGLSAGTETFSGVSEGLRFVAGGLTKIQDVLDDLETP